MTMTIDVERSRSGSRAAGAGIVLSVDRSDGFRKARRHSALVKSLRFILPAVSAGLIGIYGWSLAQTSGLTASLPAMPVAQITPEDLTMHNPHYEGTTNDGGTYTVAAKTAQQDLGNTSIIKLNAITGELTELSNAKTRLTATRGTFDHKASVLDLEERIDIVSDGGMRAQLRSAQVRTNEGLITTKEPVNITFPAGTVTSNEMTIRQKQREVTFVNAVVAKLNPPAPKPEVKPPAEGEAAPAGEPGAAAPAAEAALGAPGTGATAARATAAKLFGASDQPVVITSNRLDIQDTSKQAIFTGNVRAAQADATLMSPEMTVLYEGDAAEGVTSPAPANEAAGGPIPGGKVKEIITKGPVVMTRGTTDRVTSKSAVFNAVNETALLDGDVVMTSAPDRRATGDRVELDQKANTALLTGASVVVSQGVNVLRGRRLYIDRAGGRTVLTSPPMAGNGPGRIAARMAPKSKPTSGTAQTKPKPEAEAASVPAFGGAENFKTDPNQPLDIDADSLDVDDLKKVAVFRGDVVARQGEMQMRAAEIQAFYTGSASLADVADSDSSPADEPKSSTELTRVEAKSADVKSKVLVTTADGRKVTGDWATYDAKANQVVVGGDVVLSQGKNVVRGTRLVINTLTGHSTIDTAPANTIAAPAGGGWVTDGASAGQAQSNKGRPSAVFFPKDLKKAQGGAEPKAPAGGGGWSSQTESAPQ